MRAQGRDTVTWAELLRGFVFDGETVPLIGQRGIHRLRRVGPVPLSITTTPPKPGREAPYDDELGDDGVIRYRYFQDDPNHPDNVGLRLAWKERVPLLYFFGIEPGVYAFFSPVIVAADDPAALTVTVHVVPQSVVEPSGEVRVRDEELALREYVTRAAKHRVHQLAFRRRVVSAYRERCAMCRLRHVLDAAHILPDGHPRGLPVVPNGLALCKLHHAAFDAHLLGVTPDCAVEVKAEILEEEDGPVLLHGIQALEGQRIALPRRPEHRPDRDRLAERYETFRNAG